MTDKEFLALCRQKNDKGYDKVKAYIDSNKHFKKIKGVSGASPLHVATRSNNVKIVQLLLDKGMNPMIKDETKLTKNPIIVGIEAGSIESVMILLKSPKIKAPRTKGRYSEFSALGLNKSLSDSIVLEIAEALIKNGFDIDLLDNKRRTLLTVAIGNNDLNSVKIALKAGCDINNNQRIPLSFAFYQENQNNDIIKYLLANGADITDNNEFNALHDAHIRDNVEIFGILIKEYDALDSLDDEILDEIINYKEIDFLKFLWKIPKVHDYIIQNNLEEAFPKEVQDIFIF